MGFAEGGNAFEIFRGPRERLCGIEVAYNHERGIVRLVVRVVELAHLFERGLVEVRDAADRQMMVSVHREGRGAKILLDRTVGLIIHAHAPLFFDHLPLGFEIRLVHVEAAHAVGFEPQHALEIIAGEGFEELRGVVFRFGVVVSADGFDDARMFVRPHVRRAFEHQVLEEVREARVAGQLVFSADVIPNLKVNHRHGVIFEQNHVQTVRKRVLGEFELRRTYLGR